MTHKMKISATIIVWLHLFVAVMHGISHVGVNVLPALLDNAFLAIFVFIGPLVALFVLLNTRLTWLGTLLLFLFMLGSFLYGFWNHFLLPGVDNIATISPGLWQLPFQITASLLFVLEAAGTAIGIWGLFETVRAALLHRLPAN